MTWDPNNPERGGWPFDAPAPPNCVCTIYGACPGSGYKYWCSMCGQIHSRHRATMRAVTTSILQRVKSGDGLPAQLYKCW